MTYFNHNTTNLVYTLGDGVGISGQSNSTFSGIRQHVAGNLDGGAGHFTDFLDLGSAFAD